jgi:hypothetical protein
MSYLLGCALRKGRLMTDALETLPHRIFLDSCTAQTLRDYGSYIHESEPLEASDRIFRVRIS